MKIRKIKRVVKVRNPTHEEKQIADIFEDDSDTVKESINLDADKNVTDDTYTYVDYGLTKKESEDIWESFAKEKAKEFNTHIVKVLASFDALQSVEAHINGHFEAGIAVSTKQFVDDINSMLMAKFKTIFLNDLEFSPEYANDLFIKYISRVSRTQPNILKLVSDIKPEEEPYGALGITKGLHND